MPLTRKKALELRSLAQKKARDERGLFVAEGFRLVKDAAESAFEIPEVFFTPEFESTPAGSTLAGALRARGARCERVSAREFAGFADTMHAQGILALVLKKPASAGDLMDRVPLPALLVALDGIADPGNLGTVIRTCDWFAAGGILLGRSSVDVYNPKVVRATMGGIFHVPVATGIDLPAAAARARQQGYKVYVADPSADLFETDLHFTERSLLAFGNEAHGISPELARVADARVAIRRFGSAESLNVGVACGIFLAAHRRCFP
jgi:TrmH family RNA methyltransferase